MGRAFPQGESYKNVGPPPVQDGSELRGPAGGVRQTPPVRPGPPEVEAAEIAEIFFRKPELRVLAEVPRLLQGGPDVSMVPGYELQALSHRLAYTSIRSAWV